MNSTSAEAASTQAISPCAAGTTGASAANAGNGNTPTKKAATRSPRCFARLSLLVIILPNQCATGTGGLLTHSATARITGFAAGCRSAGHGLPGAEAIRRQNQGSTGIIVG